MFWCFTPGASPAEAEEAHEYETRMKFSALQAGYCVLVHSAAGGCGLNALAVCLAVGAVPIGTVGSQDKVSNPCSLPDYLGYLSFAKT